MRQQQILDMINRNGAPQYPKYIKKQQDKKKNNEEHLVKLGNQLF